MPGDEASIIITLRISLGGDDDRALRHALAADDLVLLAGVARPWRPIKCEPNEREVVWYLMPYRQEVYADGH